MLLRKILKLTTRETNKSPIKTTEGGRVYIDTVDFFNQPKIQTQIKQMMKSKLYKRMQAVHTRQR